jgi:hypothetical protein
MASTTEAVTAQLGRTAGVVALRDGLYSACQAYANRIIGKDAYALILSQYGNLLVALAGSGGGNPAAASGGINPGAPSGTSPGIAVAVSAEGGGSAAPQPKSPGTSNSQSAQSPLVQIGVMQEEKLGALLVACLNEADPTVRLPGDPINPLLADDRNGHCDKLIAHIVEAAPDLLKPAAASASPDNARPKTTSTAATTALQRTLVAKGQKVSVDGVFGEATLTALRNAINADPNLLDAP